jgi:polynucleotide 5'-hydroxyl-kinase GRC3/NOL9
MEGIRNLFEFWRIEVANAYVGNDDPDGRIVDTVPLIVNTMGWTKGLGADLTQQIEEMVEPNEIFEFHDESGFSYSNKKQVAIPNTGGPGRIPRMLEPAPSSILSTSFTPADHRTISILSYFHATFPSIPKRTNNNLNIDPQACIQSWDASLPLCAIAPYEVDVGVAFDQIFLTGPGSEDIVFEEVGRVLNGALVGFVQLDHHQHQGKEDKIAGIPYIQARPPPSSSESSCIGLGLIRGISTTSFSTTPSNVILHILTPIPPPLLENARILVKGELELPIWGMLDFQDMAEGVAGVEKGRVPYLKWGRVPEGVVGGDRRRVRRNLMRRGQA